MKDWISIEKEVPEIGKDVLVYSCHHGIEISHRLDEFYDDCDETNNKYAWEGQGMINTITHWMPLPEPPHGLV